MNKTYLLHITILIGCISMLFSCTDTKPSVDNDIVFDTIRTTTNYHLNNDSTQPSCSLKITYIVPVKHASDSALHSMQQELNCVFFADEVYENTAPKDAVNQYVKSFEENYNRESKLFATGDYDDEDIDKFFSIYKTLESEIVYNQNNVLSYRVTRMDYKGEKSSSTLYHNLVFNLTNGRLIEEHDLFIEDYKPVLNKIIVDKILAQNKVKTADELLSLGFWVDDFSSNGNYTADAKGITYIFNENEYSERTIGRILVFVSYEELKPILSPSSPIAGIYE